MVSNKKPEYKKKLTPRKKDTLSPPCLVRFYIGQGEYKMARIKQYYAIDCEGVSRLGLAFPFAVAVVKISQDLKISDIFYHTMPYEQGKPDANTLSWWHDDKRRKTAFETMPASCESVDQLAKKLREWAARNGKEASTEKPIVSTNNPGYDSRLVTDLLNYDDNQNDRDNPDLLPLRYSLNGGNFGVELAIKDYVNGMAAANPGLRNVFGLMYPCSINLTNQMLPFVIEKIPEALQQYTRENWNSHHPVWDALQMAIYHLLCIQIGEQK